MFANIQGEIAGRAVPAPKENRITALRLVRRLKNSVRESMGLYEIRLRLYLWELSGVAMRKKAEYGLDSVVAGKTILLVAASCIFVIGGLMMTWQSRVPVSTGVQTINAADFEPFHRPGHPAPGSTGRFRHSGFSGYEVPRDPGRNAPGMREPTRGLPAKDAINAHARIVLSYRD